MASVEEMKQELQTLIDRARDLVEKAEASNAADAVMVAAQTHRLDLVTLAITVLGILVGGFGLLGFFEIRSRAKREARKTARDEARPIVVGIVESYLNNDLPDQVRTHVETLYAAQRENEEYGEDGEEKEAEEQSGNPA